MVDVVATPPDGRGMISEPLVSAGMRNRTARIVEWFRRTGRAVMSQGMGARHGCLGRAIRRVHTSRGLDSLLRVGVKTDPGYKSFPWHMKFLR